MLTSSDFAAIASSSIVVRQLPPTTFTGICTELAAFTLSSISCYHITLCSMLRVITYSGRTCAPSDMRTECQHHRAVALTEMRKAIEQPEVAHQDVTLFVVLSLASDAVGGILISNRQTHAHSVHKVCERRERDRSSASGRV